MAQIDIDRNYTNGQALLEADLDAIQTSVKTFVNTTKFNEDNLQTNAIDAATKVVDGSVTTAKIGTGQVTSTKIADLAVTTAKILDANITTAKLAADAVTTAKLDASAVTTAKVVDHAVTVAKRSAPGVQISSLINYTTTSGTEVDVTNATVTITTTGNPVMIYLMNSATQGGTGLQTGSDTTTKTSFLLYRDSTLVATYYMRAKSSGTPSNIFHEAPAGITAIDIGLAAGTYVYKLAIKDANGSSTASGIQNCKLVAYEVI